MGIGHIIDSNVMLSCCYRHFGNLGGHNLAA